MKTKKFKQIIKKKCKEYTLTTLKNEIKSKGDNLVYKKISLQKYLKSNSINTSQAKLLFKIRSRMLHVKLNYKNMYKDKPTGFNCAICGNEPESQLHAVTCQKLPKRFKHPYKSLFSEKESIFVPAICAFEKIWNLREEIASKNK